MRTAGWLVVPALVCGVAGAQQTAQEIERGRYLVEQVAMCGDCHSPRTAKGQPDLSRRFAGAELDFVPRGPMPWAAKAPALAGLPGWTEAEMVRFLTTGINLKGARPLPPMPPYRLSQRDARAVAAYLRSLGTK